MRRALLIVVYTNTAVVCRTTVSRWLFFALSRTTRRALFVLRSFLYVVTRTIFCLFVSCVFLPFLWVLLSTTSCLGCWPATAETVSLEERKASVRSFNELDGFQRRSSGFMWQHTHWWTVNSKALLLCSSESPRVLIALVFCWTHEWVYTSEVTRDQGLKNSGTKHNIYTVVVVIRTHEYFSGRL